MVEPGVKPWKLCYTAFQKYMRFKRRKEENKNKKKTFITPLRANFAKLVCIFQTISHTITDVYLLTIWLLVYLFVFIINVLLRHLSLYHSITAPLYKNLNIKLLANIQVISIFCFLLMPKIL